MTFAILLWMIAASAIAFFLMVIDKQLAQSGARRISESTLLLWCLLGGAAGALLAASLVRHKTRKQPFARMMRICLGLNVIMLALWFVAILPPLLAAH